MDAAAITCCSRRLSSSTTRRFRRSRADCAKRWTPRSRARGTRMTKRLTREDLRGKAQGVGGILDPADLGPTLMHEHVLCDITPPKMAAQNEPDYPITL